MGQYAPAGKGSAFEKDNLAQPDMEEYAMAEVTVLAPCSQVENDLTTRIAELAQQVQTMEARRDHQEQEVQRL